MTVDSARHRPIRSFVRREGRLTAAQARALETLWPRFGVDWQPHTALDPQRLFAADKPLYLEIGFGNGEQLIHLAQSNPEQHYLGLEVHRPGVGQLLLALEREQLHNVRVLCADAMLVLEQGLPAQSLAGVYLLFPDPWSKKRHHKRRIVQPPLVQHLARCVQPGGFVHLATDWEPYAAQMLAVFEAAAPLFVNQAGAGQFSPRPPERILTRFERRGERLGHQVHDLRLIRC